jgi:hypothetical protein
MIKFVSAASLIYPPVYSDREKSDAFEANLSPTTNPPTTDLRLHLTLFAFRRSFALALDLQTPSN